MRVVVSLMLWLVFAATARADDAADLARTWDAAQVWLPGTVQPVTPADLPAATDAAAVVLYAHGCDGPGRIAVTIGRFLARAGYLVVAPDSFARTDKPQSCDAMRHRGGLHREVLGWRQAEMRFALDRVRAVPALAGLPVILMGHSEGGITVATMQADDVTARIVEGWTCHAGWPEYRGLNAPVGQPVLALVGENDPWFTDLDLKGDCGAFMVQDGPSRSVVYRAPYYLHSKHWLSGDKKVQALILDFIAAGLAQEN